jgi:hypothetical protein
MKKIIMTACVLIGAAGCVSTPAPESGNWQRVCVTRNADDVKGRTRLGDVSGSAQMIFGSPENLRRQATMKIQQEAACKGATTVLIQKDDFQSTPINNVHLLGVAYK